MAITINGNGTITGITSGAGKVIQTKAYSLSSHVYSNANGGAYLWGGGNGGSGAVNGRIQFTPESTSNRLILMSTLAWGQTNVNGGVKWLINGVDTSSANYWEASTSSTPHSSPQGYYNAFNTADDSLGINQAYSISQMGVNLITNSSYTLPSSIDFGLYYYSTNPGYVLMNRPYQSAAYGNAVSTVIIYEVESL